MPKTGGKAKRSRNRASKQPREGWAARVVRQATPKIIDSLIEAAESVREPTLKSQEFERNPDCEQVEDESLAAMLLRLLRTPDTDEEDDPAGIDPDAATPASGNSPVG